MRALFSLISQMKAYMLKESSLLILSSMLSRTMKVPDLPTPALQCTTRGGLV